MKKTGLLFVLLALLFMSVQCTEDEDVEAKVYEKEAFSSQSGEEGVDGIDSDKDE